MVFITTSRFLYKISPFCFFLLSSLSVYSSISFVYILHGNLKQLSLFILTIRTLMNANVCENLQQKVRRLPAA